MNHGCEFFGERPGAAVEPPIPTMSIAREAVLISYESRFQQRAERFLDRTCTPHLDAFGKLREAEQPIGVPCHEEHDRQSQFLPKDCLRQAPQGSTHVYRRHESRVAASPVTRNRNLVSWLS